MKSIFLIGLLLLTEFISIAQHPKSKTEKKEQSKDMLTAYERYIDEYNDAHLKEFAELIAFPSVSSMPSHKQDVENAAAWIVKKLKSIGITNAQAMPTDGLPVIYGGWEKAPNKPTILIYAHYDVQPVKESEWHSPPFAAKIEDGKIFGRGASDNKSGVMIPIWAVEAMLNTDKKLPVNVKFLFEGEEESGSPNLRKFIATHKDLLRADAAYELDDSQLSDTQPLMNMSARGVAEVEFTLSTANRDLHSGVFGGKIPNAAASLADIIASFHTPDGKVAVQDFYDGVVPMTQQERTWAANAPYDAKKEMQEYGITALVGEKGYSPQERVWYRPTLEITGMWSGYTAAEGFLNIVPGSAHCRIMCRLVEGQQPDTIVSLIKRHIESHKPQGTIISYREMTGFSNAFKVYPNTDAFKAAFAVLTELYGKEPLLMGSGGSNASMSMLKEQLGLPPYPFGFMQDDENYHSNNEFMRVSDLEKGQKAYCMLLQHIGNQKLK